MIDRKILRKVGTEGTTWCPFARVWSGASHDPAWNRSTSDRGPHELAHCVGSHCPAHKVWDDGTPDKRWFCGMVPWNGQDDY